MATRQYVGARYVPKFATPTEWNAGMTYEALTIVTYLNASYTSKIPVPAGIVPTNETYWALTGNYNAQVEQYRQEVEQVKNDITSITPAVNNFKENYINVKSYGAKGDGVTNDYQAIQTALNENAGKAGVYFPAGTYMTNQTISIPAFSYLHGDGMNTIIKLMPNSNTTVFKSHDFDNLVGTTPRDCKEGYFELSNFVIDGNWANNMSTNFEPEPPFNNSNGDGLDIFGRGYMLDRIVIQNCSNNGMFTGFASTNPSMGEWLVEPKIVNSQIHFNAIHGWVNNGSYDIQVTNLSITSSGRLNNSRTAVNLYNKNGNMRATGCHFSNEHNTDRLLAYSVWIEGGGFSCTNSHIEGAMIPCRTDVPTDFSNCTFYASFGSCDLTVKGTIQLNGCTFFPQTGSTGTSWLGAIVLLQDSFHSLLNITCTGGITLADNGNKFVSSILNVTGAGYSDSEGLIKCLQSTIHYMYDEKQFNYIPELVSANPWTSSNFLPVVMVTGENTVAPRVFKIGSFTAGGSIQINSDEFRSNDVIVISNMTTDEIPIRVKNGININGAETYTFPALTTKVGLLANNAITM